jgi:hypothetical protein
MRHYVAGLAIVGIVAMAAIVACPPAASAIPFQNPPEEFAPDWWTQFPYQRNIYWDFAVPPVGGPPGPLPGAHYQGTLDPILWESDFVELTGDTEWFPDVPVTGGTVTGAIGIDNRAGATELTGTAVFHLDNKGPDAVKHVWDEATYVIGGGAIFLENMVVPPDYDVTGAAGPLNHELVDPALDLWRDNWWWQIEPNPPWEEKVMTFIVPPGGFVFVDDYHVATECVPEPTTVIVWSLVAAVGIAFGWSQRRKK